MSGFATRPVVPADHAAIRTVLSDAFDSPVEADLVEALRAGGNVVLELAAHKDERLVGHVLFSRLQCRQADAAFPAVALAPLTVARPWQRRGVGRTLVEAAHARLREAGETLSVVLGDPAYYGRFGYAHGRAAGFESDYQCEALQAFAWGDAPAEGRLVYPHAFAGL